MTPTPTVGIPHYALFPAGVLLAQADGEPQLCTTWTYTLVVDQDLPSRMAVVKNVLGNSVDIITPWEAPVWPAFTNPNWLCSGTCTITGPELVDVAPTAVGQHWQHRYNWTIVYDTPQLDPGTPFNVYNTANPSDPGRRALPVGEQWTFRDFTTGSPTFGNALIFTENGAPLVRDNAVDAIFQPHLDVVGQNKDLVNWGLEVFSTGIDYVVGSGVPGRYDKQVGIVQIMDTSDRGDVTSIETAMGLIASGGQNVFGATPTMNAIDFVKTVLQDTASGTAAGAPLTDDLGHSFDLPADPKIDCNRQYASILVTDGISNIGNPAGCNNPPGYQWGNWVEPCWACDCSAAGSGFNGGSGCPDGGDSGHICPDDYTEFAAGKAEDAWNAQVIDPATGLPKNLNVRTWVIGISKEVAPCELNYTAYRGRTDASSPNSDAGFDTAADPYLPEGSPGNYDGPTSATPCTAGLSHTPAHGNYAFFAGSASQLYNALSDVLGAYGVGNYTTSAPTVSSGVSVTNIGFITTAEYPGWRGHVYAFDLSSPIVCHADGECPTVSNGIGRCNTTTGDCKAPDTYRLVWDAGEVVSAYSSLGASKTVNNGLPRKIYSWDPSQLGPTGNPARVLVPIETANVAALNAICNSCGVTAQVVDFIRGNDGNGSARRWALGSILNSTAAIIGTPVQFKQFAGHAVFENAYKTRTGVAWLGSSDGALHGFDINDGAEVVALIPPDKLDQQVQLYNNYRSDPTRFGMGELKLPGLHVYGVANSPGFGDIYDPSAQDGTNYRTVLYLTEGPGGTGLHAIDVTHPSVPRTYPDGSTYGGDPNYGYGIATYDPSNPEAAPPVMPLWSLTKDGKAGTTVLSDLTNTWSIPAVGGEMAGSAWELVLGNGYVNYDPSNISTANPIPHYFRLDPLTGSVRDNKTFAVLGATQTAGGPWVRDQAFADTSIWSLAAGYFQQDNDVSEGVQLDLQGRVWLVDRQDMATTIWKNPLAMPDPDSVVAGDPLYYAAAIASYPAVSPVYNLYAFSSGSFYELSSLITGSNVGLDPAAVGDPKNFIPGLFLASRTIEASPTTVIRKIEIRSIQYTGSDGNLHYLGHRTQVTAPPLIFVPNPGKTGLVAAAFLVFDPDASCAGVSYVVLIAFQPSTLGNAGTPWTVRVAEAGQGAASGMAVAGTLPVVSKSFAGTGGTGYFYLVKGIQISGAGGAGAPISWWAELQ